MTRTHTLRPAGLALLVLALVPMACTGDQPAPEEAEMTAAGDAAPLIPPSFVYVQHPVEDFDVWLDAYNAFDEERDAAQVAEIWVYRDIDNPDVIHVLHGAADVATLRAFVGMEELASAMKEAGVVGPPRFDFMNFVDGTGPAEPVASQYSLLVAHDVADWGRWKQAFDAHKAARDAVGMTNRGIARGVENPNRVYINFALRDLESARAFAASQDLKNVMAGAGVVGMPELYFTETVLPAM